MLLFDWIQCENYKSSLEKYLENYRFDEAEKYYENIAKEYVSREWFDECIEKYRLLYNRYIEEQKSHKKDIVENILSTYTFPHADKVYREIFDNTEDLWYQERVLFYKVKLREEKLKKYLSTYDFDKAEKYYESKGKEYVSRQWFDKCIEEYRQEQKSHKKEKDIIENILSTYNFSYADKIYREIFNNTEDLWYQGRVLLYKAKLHESRLIKIFSDYDFVKAEKYYMEKANEFISKEWYVNERDRYRKKYNSLLLKNAREIYDFLSKSDFVSAKNFYHKLAPDVRNKINYDELVANYEKLGSLLKNYDFVRADRMNTELCLKKYETIKLRFSREWFLHEVKENGRPYILDNEQLLAVQNLNKNTIVTARAGSGKTRVLVAKIVYLCSKYNVNPNEILAFVFNKKARDEINSRLQNITISENKFLNNSEIGRTFHSFAYRIVFNVCQYTKPIILQGNVRTRFIKSIIALIVPKPELYRYFRIEALTIDKSSFCSEEQYYDVIRNSRYQTLDGHQVKSQAEKIIADYLFEHDIDYYYENEYVIGDFYPFCLEDDRKQLYEIRNNFEEEFIKPDFYLPKYKLFWEHWAITGGENSKEIEDLDLSRCIGDYNFYKNRMDWKKWFYGRSWVNKKIPVKSKKMFTQILDMRGLIETYRPKDMSREEFENCIDRILQQHGIYKEKLSSEKLIEKVWAKQIDEFSVLVEQFIDRTQQDFYRNEIELEQKILTNNFDIKIKCFYDIAWQCYKKYQGFFAGNWMTEELEQFREFSSYNSDFNTVMKKAIELIDAKTPEVIAYLSCVKYILIDEYQDFNKLFYNLLMGVRNIVPDTKLFVVGDDWQAINRFMGADVCYFNDFESFFPEDVIRLEISTNYRCSINVVKFAERFVDEHMGFSYNYRSSSQEYGAAGTILFDADEKNRVSKMFQQPEGELYVDSMTIKINDEKNYLPSAKSVWYLKYVAAIIHQNSNASNFIILHRNGDTSFWRITLEEFEKRLCRVIVNLHWMTESEFKNKIKVMTIHKAKGLEADVVILLEGDSGIIPSYSSKSQLFTLFGETPEIVLNDEKNLFYVAITRARHKLYVLHDLMPEGKNGFLEGMENLTGSS